MDTREYVAGAELPDMSFNLEDPNGATLDLSTGWTLSATISGNGITPINKTTGIAGAASSPNVTIQWAVADLGSLAAGKYLLTLQARRTSDSKDRKVKVRLIITPA